MFEGNDEPGNEEPTSEERTAQPDAGYPAAREDAGETQEDAGDLNASATPAIGDDGEKGQTQTPALDDDVGVPPDAEMNEESDA